MNSLKFSRLLGAAAPLLALTACAYGPPLAKSVEAVPNAKVTIQSVRAYTSDRGIYIRGTVRRAFPAIGPLPGHLHITAVFANTGPVEIDTGWSGSLSRRNRRVATFSALIETSSPERLQSISIAYRPGQDDRG